MLAGRPIWGPDLPPGFSPAAPGMAELSIVIGPESSNWEAVPVHANSGAFQIPLTFEQLPFDLDFKATTGTARITLSGSARTQAAYPSARAGAGGGRVGGPGCLLSVPRGGRRGGDHRVDTGGAGIPGEDLAEGFLSTWNAMRKIDRGCPAAEGGWCPSLHPIGHEFCNPKNRVTHRIRPGPDPCRVRVRRLGCGAPMTGPMNSLQPAMSCACNANRASNVSQKVGHRSHCPTISCLAVAAGLLVVRSPLPWLLATVPVST